MYVQARSPYNTKSLVAGIALLYLLCSSFNAFAQRYPFYNLSVENGLIQSQVQAIKQDKFGHLWIGTIGGLSRYDGKNFVNYSVRDGMDDNNVSSLDIDNAGNIWVGTRKGVSKFDGDKFRHFSFQPAENNMTANNVITINSTDNGTLWCLVGNDVKRTVYSVANGKTNKLDIPGKDTTINAIFPDKNDLWVSKKAGPLLHYHNNTWDTVSMPLTDKGRVPHVIKMYRSRNGILWMLTTSGIYHLNKGLVLPYTLPGLQLRKLPIPFCMTEDKSGAYWIGTNVGVIKLTDSTVNYYNKHNGLSDNQFNDILTDVEGNVWMASDGQGLFRSSGSPFTVLDESMGLPSAQVMAITADKAGRLYFGTYDAGLYLFEKGQIGKINSPFPSLAITALCHKFNKVWIGTRGALLSYDNEFHVHSFADSNIFSVSALRTDTFGRMWVGYVNGAILYERDSFHILPIKRNSLVSDFITISRDSVLIATGDYIQLYSNGQLSQFKTGGAPDSAMAQCFTMRGSELWIGTSDNGIICYDLHTKKYFVLNKSNGLQSDFIYNIITDNDGNIWAGTGYGIHKVSMVNGTPVISFYGKEQGIHGMESNHNAVYKMPDGSIWFGTTNGAIHYEPHTGIAAVNPVSIALQSVRILGENVTDTTWYDSTNVWYKVPYGMHLPYRKNNITFTFQAISLSGGEQLLYRYRMDGLDAPWSDWSPNNSVTYSALPPGNYTLQVQCNAADSTGKMKELAYSFEIITPFQKTNWFKLIILGACILLGVSLQYIANRRKQDRLKLMETLRREEQSKVRMRTAEDFHDEVGNKLTRINVLSNVLKKKIDLNADAKRIIDQIQDNTGQLYSGTRDILWSLKPSNDSLYEILNRIRDFGGELFQDTEIDFSFTGIDGKWKEYTMPMDLSRNLIMIFKEALNNILKYASATKVTLEAGLHHKDVLQLELHDNGKGFDLQHAKKGHGIDNMNVRAERINGILHIDSHEGKGTIIRLSFRLPHKQGYKA